MTHLKIGEKAPDFIINEAQNLKLSDLMGKKLIIFFYPKDNTPTCTIEACNLRDNYHLLKKEGFEVIGVSPDSEKSHQKFSTRFDLPYTLVADIDQSILKNYGVWGEKTLFGRKYMGVLRTTFVIDELGNIEKIIDKVKALSHTAQILMENGL